MGVSFIGRGHPSTRRKPQTFHKSKKNFILITQSLYNVLVDTVCGYMYMHNIKKRCIVTTAKKLTMEIKFIDAMIA
jgi:hypothetical protein